MPSTTQQTGSNKNRYVSIFIDNYVATFRNYCRDVFALNIYGLGCFVENEDNGFSFLLKSLKAKDINVTLLDNKDTTDKILVDCVSANNEKCLHFEYRIESLLSIIELSGKTGISTAGIILMQIVSMLICQKKIQYKAIVLDLDETLWYGTLAEEGVEAIRERMRQDESIPFRSFMKFIEAVSKELGIYVAICSRNEASTVEAAINVLSYEEFPLKGQIDCIIANNNDKSRNIKGIAEQLQILPNAIIFIDDNQIVRDEVRRNLPQVFVPEWSSHDELVTMFIVCCLFDRFELSMNSRKRKRIFKILHGTEGHNQRPQLSIKVMEDPGHTEARRLYAKSNQFQFAPDPNLDDVGVKSFYLEIFRSNGENLGICSAFSYMESEDVLTVIDWAISCRYFEIGLEEFVLSYLHRLAHGRQVSLRFRQTAHNQKGC